MVESAEKDAHVEADLAVEHAERDALLGIGGPIFALHHGDQVIVLEPLRFFQHLPVLEQRRRLFDMAEIFKEGGREALGILHDDRLDRHDPHNILVVEADEFLSPHDVVGIEAQPVRLAAGLRHRRRRLHRRCGSYWLLRSRRRHRLLPSCYDLALRHQPLHEQRFKNGHQDRAGHKSRAPSGRLLYRGDASRIRPR